MGIAAMICVSTSSALPCSIWGAIPPLPKCCCSAPPPASRGFGSVLDDRQGHGLYRISELRQRQLWDQHLARDPDLASLVRGLASQHAFPRPRTWS